MDVTRGTFLQASPVGSKGKLPKTFEMATLMLPVCFVHIQGKLTVSQPSLLQVPVSATSGALQAWMYCSL